ncbi:MAG: threonine synthase [Bacteroidales bacterium]|jgi:threonine synthase
MKRIEYYNINDPEEKVSLRTAVLKGIAGYRGLYMPDHIPVMDPDFFKKLPGMTLQEISFEVSRKFLTGSVPDDAILEIVNRSFNFPIPLVQLGKRLHVLELFHGPTLAFKDVGARFMAALFEYLLRGENREATVLVATSGDTGSAAASAFYKSQGIRVVILYPSGRVSKLQEKMLTSIGENVIAIEVEGDFDDCQRLVKEAFIDPKLISVLNLTSANSINFARLLPQTFYYFHAAAQIKTGKSPLAISVPSGNFGNLTAGLFAWKMGLDIGHFIASSNANHSFADYLKTGQYKPKPSVHTITTAMDVGDPSNFPRLLKIFNGEHSKIRSLIDGCWFTDKETSDAMKELYEKYGYLADPHGAVAYLGLKKYMEDHDVCGIFLETAHPSKFESDVESATGRKVIIPDSLNDLLRAEGRSVKINASFMELKRLLLHS